MSDSITLRIRNAVVALLDDPAKPNGLQVDTQRFSEVAEDERPLVSVYLVSEKVEPPANTRIRPVVMKRLLTIEAKIRVAGGDDAADPIRQWIVAQIGKDMTLGGLAINAIEVEGEWDGTEGANGELTDVPMRFEVEYQTKTSDLTVKA